MTCANHPERPVHAHGLCRRCYDSRRGQRQAPLPDTFREAVATPVVTGRVDQLFQVAFPHIQPPLDADIITGVIYGDTHGQYIDASAEGVLLAVLKDFQPDVVVHIGDAVDCYTISRFDKDPTRKETLQDEIDHARRHLARVRLTAPNAAMYLFEGNHEERLHRAFCQSQGGMREVVQLTAFQEAMTWPNLLQLQGLGVNWVPLKDQPDKSVFPKFLLTHGSVVRKWSGWSAAGEWQRYGKSGASGHVHRLGVFMHRDLNGAHVWVETGCLCGLEPDYTGYVDWQNGFVVVTFEQRTGAFQVEPVYVHKGNAMWRGKKYQA